MKFFNVALQAPQSSKQCAAQRSMTLAAFRANDCLAVMCHLDVDLCAGGISAVSSTKQADLLDAQSGGNLNHTI